MKINLAVGMVVILTFAKAYSQTTVVTSPAWHSMDYGTVPQYAPNYQPPEVIQWGQAGAASVAPINTAIQQGINNQNQFLLNQINNDAAIQRQQLQESAELEMQRRSLQAQARTQEAQHEIEIKNRLRSDRIESAVALVRQNADRNQARIEQGVLAIENP